MLLNAQSEKKTNNYLFFNLTAFLGYVLPFGQMSLWGATVITNLLSAIPWLGKSLVEFVWGGLYQKNIKINTEEPNKYENIFIFVKKILLYAGKSCNSFIEYAFFYYTKSVKKSIIIRQSAEIRKCEYSTFPFSKFSQRLEAGNYIYPYLVGLFEGDGWFSVSKKGKYVMYEFGIELSIRDVQLLYKIKKLLGVGTILFRYKENIKEFDNKGISTKSLLKINNESKRNNVLYRVRNKSHLKEVIIPIFDKYPFLTKKQYDYIRLRNALLSNIIYSKDLLPYVRPNVEINTVTSILNTSYFSSWLIGFIEAESSFCIYKPIKDSSHIASFEITQTKGEVIILAIKKLFNLIQNIRVDDTNNFKLKVSSIRAIENVINFMDKEPAKLIGYKKIQYIIWLKRLRQIPRYSFKIKIPQNY